MPNRGDEIEIVFKSNGVVNKRIAVSDNTVVTSGGKTAQETQYLKQIGQQTKQAAQILKDLKSKTNSSTNPSRIRSTDKNFKAMMDFIAS